MDVGEDIGGRGEDRGGEMRAGGAEHVSRVACSSVNAVSRSLKPKASLLDVNGKRRTEAQTDGH